MIDFREPPIGLIPVITFQQIQHDAIGGLLVAIPFGVLVVKESLWIVDAGDQLLSENGAQTSTVRVRRFRRHRRPGRFVKSGAAALDCDDALSGTTWPRSSRAAGARTEGCRGNEGA